MPKLMRANFRASGFFLLVLLSSFSLSGNGQVASAASTASGLQRNSLTLTVGPDRSVAASSDTTTILSNATVPMNFTSLFPSGYAIHSTSSFTQQGNAVVQTSNVQYQLPQQLVSQTPLNNITSISFTATQTGLTGQGSLTINTNPGPVFLPISNIVATYSYTLVHVQVDASAQVYFFPALNATLPFLANQTAFQTEWASTFENATWRSMIINQIENSTRYLVTVTSFAGTITSINNVSATISITLQAIPAPSYTDFVAALESTLSTMGGPIPAGVDNIIRGALALSTSGSATVTYTGSTRTVVVQSTENYVADLDSQVNRLKTQYFQLLFASVPAGTPIPPQLLFLNSTSVTVSRISTTSDLDFSSSTSKMTFQGLIIKPPTVGSNTNFTIPGLFQTLGSQPTPPPGLNLTLAGGSNATYSVKVVVPAGVPAPSSTTANSATWTNIQNTTSLSNVRFVLERVPSNSLLDFLTSPLGIAFEVIAALAIITAVVLLTRRRRAALPAPAAGPATVPGVGPEPAPPPP